jgi:ATP-dependent DNA ligase
MASTTGPASGARAHPECMAAARPLPHGLAGPVDVALARPADTVPEQTACPGGCRYELKFDGFRVAVVRTANGARLWSRRGTDLTSAFPDLAAAAEFHLRSGTVLDGEAVMWVDGRLRFDHLQRRLARRASRAVPEGSPASYVAFDVLALDAGDQRGLAYTARRALLERLSTGWAPPLEICPSTADREEAMGWSTDYRPAGIEGLVIKSAHGRYPTGRRDWIKVKNRQTREVIVGAVIGSISRPESVIAAAFIDGELAFVGRTVALTAAQARDLAERLTPADDNHPWPDEIGTGVFGKPARVTITKVRPELVLEVAADPALHGRRYRHALRYLRLRTDMDPTDVDAHA